MFAKAFLSENEKKCPTAKQLPPKGFDQSGNLLYVRPVTTTLPTAQLNIVVVQ